MLCWLSAEIPEGKVTGAGEGQGMWVSQELQGEWGLWEEL